MSEIAEQTGFSSASYMAETFKRFYMLSPREYKKAMSK
jgi:AraC-like DNA-binding protein